jgi:nucleoside-diphosphate-sugar epimerase
MVMPDAIKALLLLADAPRESLAHDVYNVSSFSLSAGDVAQQVRSSFPLAEVHFAPDPARQGIVDTWPTDVDDSAARRDWAWSPDYDLERAFNDYLVPRIRDQYRQG